MSDQIVINDNTAGDSIFVNQQTPSQTITVNTGGGVISVNGQNGIVNLTKFDIGLGLIDNTSDLDKPISNATLSALLLKANLSAFNILNNFVLSKYGSWDSVYSVVNFNSGGWTGGGGGSSISPVVSGIWQSSASTVSSLSTNWNLGYQAVSTTNALALSSIYWNTAYSLVSGGIVVSFSLPQSANWQSTYSTVSSLSANWNSVYTTFNTNSGSLTILSSNSANWQTAYQSVSTTNTLNLSSVYWNTGYNLIQSNSAINWNYQGTDLKGLSANWQTAYQSVSTTNTLNLSSVYWNTAYTIGTTYQNASGSFATNTILQSTSALLTPLTTTSTLTSQLVTNTNFNNYQTSVASLTATLLPTNIYQNASSSFITTVSGTSNQINVSKSGSTITLSLPTSAVFPGDVSIIGNLTLAGSATYIDTKNLVVGDNLIYFNDNNYGSNVLDIGLVAHFSQAPLGYNHTGLVRRAGQGNPGTWTLFSGLTTEPLSAANIDWSDRNIVLDSLSANLIGNVTGNANTVTNGVYTNQSYSDPSWITSLADSKITGTKFSINALPLSGGQLTGFVTSTSSISAQKTITSNNIAVNSQLQFLSANTVKVYQFYNSLTNSLDTVFN